MTAYRDMSREELLELKSRLEKEFEDVKGKGLKLDMSRGKPSKAQLDLSMGMMDVLKSTSDLVCEEEQEVPRLRQSVLVDPEYHQIHTKHK